MQEEKKVVVSSKGWSSKENELRDKAGKKCFSADYLQNEIKMYFRAFPWKGWGGRRGEAGGRQAPEKQGCLILQQAELAGSAGLCCTSHSGNLFPN